MTSVFQLVDFVLQVAWYIVIVHALMSWLIGMRVMNLSNRFVYQIWNSLEQLLNPVYTRIRQFLPNTGFIDLSPLVLIFGIYFLQRFIANNLY